ncbi:MAG: glycosyltransferase family 4 protein [Longimicrobiales bacterium]
MRVLHCIYDDPENPWVAGGGAVRARALYRRLAGRVQAVVATGNYPGAHSGVFEGVGYVRLGASSPYAWSRASYALAAAALLRRGARLDEYDVAIYDFSVYAPVRIPPWPAPVGVIVHHLTGPTAPARWGRMLGAGVAALERSLLRRASWASTPSEWTRERLREVLRADGTIEVVGNGVDDALFELPRDDRGGLLYFGRLDLFQKGLDVLLRALALLVERGGDVVLDVAGRGRDAERFQELAAELGVAGRIRMHGPVDGEHRLRLFRQAGVLVMPSRFEGFGMVAAEAQAAGVPVVATTAGALPEVVAQGGVLVPPEDPAALAGALAGLLGDADRRAALGRLAREAAQRHRWDAVAERHLAFLEHVVAAAKTAGGARRPRGDVA